MNLIEAAKAALEALEGIEHDPRLKPTQETWWKAAASMRNLRAAIEEAEKDKPAAWIASNRSPITAHEYRKLYFTKSHCKADWIKEWTPLYLHPVPALLYKCDGNHAVVTPRIPDGWRLMPEEPIEEMLLRMSGQNGLGPVDNWNAYRAAFSSAPEYYP